MNPCSWLLTLAALAGSACAHGGSDPLPAPDTAPPPVRLVTETVTVRDRDAEQRLIDLQMQVADKDQQIEELQQRLEEAQRDVVRSMAKVQTLATRAEAASAMAEAEVALETLRRAAGAQGTEVARTTTLLEKATNEFNHQNYGGALWLSNQARNRAAAARSRLIGTDSLKREGEQPFTVPVRFETTVRTNLRAGPGTNFQAITTLDAGAAVTAYSHLEQWIRVVDSSGRAGWVYYSLVRRPAPAGN